MRNREFELAEPPQRRWTRPLFIGLAILLAALLIVLAIWWERQDVEVIAIPQTEVRYSAAELAVLLDRNTAAADEVFEAPIIVTGTFEGAETVGGANPIVQLGTGNPLLELYAEADKIYAGQIAAVAQGEPISLRCSGVDRGVTAPILQECVPVGG